MLAELYPSERRLPEALMQRIEEMVAWQQPVGFGPFTATASLDDERSARITLYAAMDDDRTTRIRPPVRPAEPRPAGAES